MKKRVFAWAAVAIVFGFWIAALWVASDASLADKLFFSGLFLGLAAGMGLGIESTL